MPQGFTRSDSLQHAIQKIERRFPKFLQKDYTPPPQSSEEEVFVEYRSLKDSLYRAQLAEVARRYVEAGQAADKEANAALARMGLAPIPDSDREALTATVAGESRTSRSMKLAKGELCEQVIREVCFLKQRLLKQRKAPDFESLRRACPRLRVLELLAHRPFDDDDRYLVCHPGQWGVRAVTYATGLLKKVFEVGSDETIRSYRKAYKRGKQQRSRREDSKHRSSRQRNQRASGR